MPITFSRANHGTFARAFAKEAHHVNASRCTSPKARAPSPCPQERKLGTRSRQGKRRRKEAEGTAKDGNLIVGTCVTYARQQPYNSGCYEVDRPHPPDAAVVICRSWTVTKSLRSASEGRLRAVRLIPLSAKGHPQTANGSCGGCPMVYGGRCAQARRSTSIWTICHSTKCQNT